MAHSLADTPLNIENKKFFRKPHYWIVRCVSNGMVYTFKGRLMIFSGEDKALTIADEMCDNYLVEVMFWEELCFRFGKFADEAVVDFLGEPEGTYTRLDLNEEYFKQPESSLPLA